MSQEQAEPRLRDQSPGAVEEPWALGPEEAAEELGVELETGLSGRDVRERMRKYGPNRLQRVAKRSAWKVLFDQFKNLIVALLGAAAAASFFFGQWLEGVSILIALALNVIIGFFTELKAVRSIESLQELSKGKAKVKRGGSVKNIPAEKLVPGDVVVLEAGDVLPADIRLTEVSRLQADESPLTGESMPRGKTVHAVDRDAPLAERTCMGFKGTVLTQGSGHGVVAATGGATEIGRISAMAEAAEGEVSPLEKRLDRLGRRLVWVTLAVAAAVGASGAIKGQDTFLIFETSVALAVAAIPEGLPVVATIALAKGMWRMARRNALINKLSAVETLGSVNTICADKTGTLTENRMQAVRFDYPDKEPGSILSADLEGERPEVEGENADESTHGTLFQGIRVGVLCNNAYLGEESGEENVGDPLEIALLQAGARVGMRREKLLEKHPEVREEAFDPEVQMMATVHETNDGHLYAVKGSPEAVLDACETAVTGEGSRPLDETAKKNWLDRNGELAEKGLRILAFASKTSGSGDENAYAGLEFLGLAGLNDPPRKDVKEAIRKLQNAGIKVVMATGDQPRTATGVARAVGIEDGKDLVRGGDFRDPDTLSEDERRKLGQAAIYARVSPEQKLDLIELIQADGSVVAMTGDGVNDAPALKKADIGVAMGERGTQAAREASDMILKDDALSSIVLAVEEGRIIFDNIRRFIIYLLSGNAGEIMIVALALLLGWGLPLLPLQILYLNMLSDVFPALALGVGQAGGEVMDRPPRPAGEPVLTKDRWLAVALWGGLIAAAVLAAYLLALTTFSMDRSEAVTVSFLTLAFARLWHVFNMRTPGTGLLVNAITANPFVWGAIGLCSVLLLAAVYAPVLSEALKLSAPDVRGWSFILLMSMVPLAVGQVVTSKTAQAIRKKIAPRSGAGQG